jgi:VanZ family protein
MGLSLRQRVTAIVLAVYWPTFFYFAHIPVPGFVRQAGVHDKGLHFFAYLVLTFLVWFSIRPDTKVNWRGASAWLVLLVMILYAVGDEVSQGYMGRSCDWRDLASDAVGSVAALVLASLASFWPAALIVCCGSLFGMTNIARTDLSEVMPRLNLVFHFCGYAALTAIWIGYAGLLPGGAAPRPRAVLSAAAAPVCFLAAVKLFAKALGRAVAGWEVLASVAAIVCVAGAFFLVGSLRARPQAQKRTLVK